MPEFSQRSLDNLDGVHPQLKTLLHVAIQYVDFSVVSGVRTEAEQQALYAQGRTEPGPKVTNIDGVNELSNHQIQPQTGYGHAVDIYPYPWTDPTTLDASAREKAYRRFVAIAYFLKGCWAMICDLSDAFDGEIRWGGDWDSDHEFADQSFDDLPHIELVTADEQTNG